MTTADKLRALTLSAVMVFATFAGVVTFSGAAVGAEAGNVSLSINAAGNQATVIVDDGDLNTDSSSVESHVVNIESDSENPTATRPTGSDTPDSDSQNVTISKAITADRNHDGTIDTADFSLSGASDESIVAVHDNGTNWDVEIEDSGGATSDSNTESVSYTQLDIASTGSDTDNGSPTTITTSAPLGDRDGDGDIDSDDVTLIGGSDDESVTSVSHNADGTADIEITDSNGDGDNTIEQVSYLAAETVSLSETGQDTGKFSGTIDIKQTDSDGVLQGQDGDAVTAIYWDDGGSTERTDSKTLSLSDTTAPSISSVSLGESSGNMDISFGSDEQLGSSDGDLNVTVTGPNGKTYSFDRSDFSESGSGPYAYSLSTTQGYDDGDGTYSLSIDDAKDSAGNNGGNNGDGSGLTDTYDFSSSGGGSGPGGGGGVGDTNTFINGTVTNESGTAIDGATAVALPQAGGSEIIDTTDANGDYSLEVNPDTKYEVIIDNHPENPYEIKRGISVSDSNTKTLDFQLKSFPGKGYLNGTVLDENGNPVGSGVSVSARDMGYRFSGSTTTDSNGEFSLHLPAADYIVRTQRQSSPPDTLEGITVKEGETTDVTLQFPQTGYISGKVTDASGNAQNQIGVVADSGNQIVFDRTNSNGKYNITAPEGNFTVSVFARDKDAPSKEVTVSGGNTAQADFTLKTTKVTHSSVEVVSGSGVQTGDLGIRAGLEMGMLRVKLVNESKSGTHSATGAPHELENLGVTEDTKFRMNITVTNFTASSLMWGVDDARWSTSQNESNPNATDITVTGTPTQIQVKFSRSGSGVGTGIGPLMFKDPSEVSWPTGRNDRATAGRNQTVYFGVFDLSNMPGQVQNRMKGMSVTTNSQRFSTPKVVNNSLRVWVAAPTKTVDGNDHNGFYQAEIPDAQLAEWGIDDPESELEALYKGDPANFTVTETSDGARIRLENISYSAGYAEVQANPSAGGGGGGGGGSSTPTQTTASVEGPTERISNPPGGEPTGQPTTGVSVKIEHVSAANPRVTVPVDSSTGKGLSVSEVSVSFEMGTSVDNRMTVAASTTPPANVPESDDEGTIGYVSVDIEGNLADSVSGGSFLIRLDKAGLGDVDPESVTAKRYHDGEWQTVDTEPLNDSVVRVLTPGYSTFAISTEPEDPTTPTPEQSTPTPTPDQSTPTPDSSSSDESTDTPASTPDDTPTPDDSSATATPTDGSDTPAPTATPTATPESTATPTPGASGPGFGLLVAVLALLAVTVARLRKR